MFFIGSLSNNQLNLMRFGQIRRFPSRKQPVDDFGRNYVIARAILLGQRRDPGFDINNVDSRIVRGVQTNAMLAQLAANVRGPNTCVFVLSRQSSVISRQSAIVKVPGQEM
jgi:hypothetical protein